MFRLVVLKLIVGMVTGALTVGAVLPILLMVPSFVGSGMVVFLFGSSVIVSALAGDIRRAAGRSLMMLGSVLVLMPLLSVTLGVLPIASIVELSAKSDKYSYVLEPLIWQIFATFVAFGAGSIVSIAGFVVMLDGRKRALHSMWRSGSDLVPSARPLRVSQANSSKRDDSAAQTLQKSAETNQRRYSSGSGISSGEISGRIPESKLRAKDEKSPPAHITTRTEIAINAGYGLRATEMLVDVRSASYAASQGEISRTLVTVARSSAEQKLAVGMTPLIPITPSRSRSAHPLSVSNNGNSVDQKKPQEAGQLTPPRQETASANGDEFAGTKHHTMMVAEAPPSEKLHSKPIEVIESTLVSVVHSSRIPDQTEAKDRRGLSEIGPVENVLISLDHIEDLQTSNEPSVAVEFSKSQLASVAEDDISETPTETVGKSSVTLMDRDRHRLIAKQIADLANSVRRPETKQ